MTARPAVRKRHYLKIPAFVAPWYPGERPDDWRTAIFNDVTDHGKGMVVEPLPSNAKGARAAIHGDLFRIQIGKDDYRDDTLFVMRLENATEPRRVPKRFAASFVLWPGGSPPSLDPRVDTFDDLFGDQIELSEEEDEDEQLGVVEPSPRLRVFLSSRSLTLLPVVRPRVEPAAPESPTVILVPLRRMWARYRLDRFTDLSPRQQLLLTGTTTPAQLGSKERRALFSRFDVALLNKLVLEQHVDLEAFVTDLCHSSVPLPVRLQLWLSALDNLKGPELRRQLFEVRDWLAEMTLGDRYHDTRRTFVTKLRELAHAGSDDELLQLLDTSPEDLEVTRAMSDWIRDIQFVGDDAPSSSSQPHTGPVPTMPTAERLVQSHVAPAVDSWIMRLRGIDTDALVQIQERMARLSSLPHTHDEGPPDLGATIAFAGMTRELHDLAASWLSTWPDDEELQKDRQEAAQAYNTAHDVLGDGIDSLLSDAPINPKDLSVIAALTTRSDVLDHVPDWLWLLDDDSPNVGLVSEKDLMTYAIALLRPEIRNRVQTLVRYVDELGERTALQWLDAPSPGVTVEDHVDRWYHQVRDFLRAAPAELVAILKTDRHPGTDLQTLVEDATRLPYLREALAPSVADDVISYVNEIENPTARRDAIVSFCGAVDFYRNSIGDTKDAPFKVLLSRMEKHGGTGYREPDDDQVTLNHNWMVDSSRTRATLVLKRPDDNLQYGILSVPLALETRRPRPMVVRMEWTYRDIGPDGAWPAEWPRPEPEEATTIPVYSWRPQQHPSAFEYCFGANLPIRVPRGRLPRFQLTAVVREDRTGRELTRKQLRWDAFLPSAPKLAVRWRDEASPDYVREHPIGPQRHADAILERLGSGSSVAVTAPRRFGKSSLVAYLAKEIKKANIVVPDPIECTFYASSTGFDHQRLWSDVSESLQDVVGAALARVEGDLPGPKGFDHVRRAARKKNVAAVVLLFDEAQLLFPSASGWEIGSRLKTLLANHWSRTDDASMAPVLFGFVGLPSLSRRAGADAMGLLHPVEYQVMDEAQLRPLITRLVTGLQTSREARSRLADAAGNLLVLRAMLEGLVQRLNQDQRAWANFDDVVAVEVELQRHLRNGRQEHVASWIRDVLNGADRVEEWQPLPCFPSAVALALSRTAGSGLTECIPSTVNKLNEWCQSFTRGSANVIPMYDEERVKEHIQQLKERQIVGDAEFASGFLEAWLTGVGRRAAFDEAFQQALYRGAHKQIAIPREASKVRTGGQATIWRDREGNRVYRVKSLSSVEEKRVFLEGTEMLRDLREIVARRESGSDHIFEVLEMGLARGGQEAVQVYRWVPGEDLSGRRASLAAEAVIELGTKLSRAVALLHRHNILHRDICPRNIVLDNESDTEALRPVLIDFGFARLATTPMNTALAGEHLAPEVQGKRPQWTKAADVYGLGSTLRWMAHPSAAGGGVMTVLEEATREATSERIAIERLLEEFSKLAESERLDERRNSIWGDIVAAAGPDGSLPWFSAQLRKSRADLLSLAMGFQPTLIGRSAGLASFVNQVLEGHPSNCLSLKRLRRAEGVGDGEAIATLWALRNRHVHAGDAGFEETRRLVGRFGKRTVGSQRRHFVAGVEAVGRSCGLKALRAVVECVLERGG